MIINVSVRSKVDITTSSCVRQNYITLRQVPLVYISRRLRVLSRFDLPPSVRVCRGLSRALGAASATHGLRC